MIGSLYRWLGQARSGNLDMIGSLGGTGAMPRHA